MKEASEEYIKKVIELEKKHFKKYGFRSMNISDLRKLIEGKYYP